MSDGRFRQSFQQKRGQRLEKMWAIVSAIGLWANVENISELISKSVGQSLLPPLTYSDTDDGDKTCKMIGVLGCALLTALSAIDRAGELKPDSRFLDLALVIDHFLELSYDLPDCGIEGTCVSWRKEAVAILIKAKLDPSNA